MNTHGADEYADYMKPIAGFLACLVAVLLALAVATWGALHPPVSIAGATVFEEGPTILAVASDHDNCPCAGLPDSRTLPRGKTPGFTALNLFRGTAGYTFWYPDGWAPCDLSWESYGVLLVPESGESDTWFSVEASLTGVTSTSAVTYQLHLSAAPASAASPPALPAALPCYIEARPTNREPAPHAGQLTTYMNTPLHFRSCTGAGTASAAPTCPSISSAQSADRSLSPIA